MADEIIPDIERAMLEMSFEHLSEHSRESGSAPALKVLDSQFEQILQSDEALRVWSSVSGTEMEAFETRLAINSEDSTASFNNMCIGIACLQLFIQENFTGPSFPLTVSELLKLHPAQTEASLNSYCISRMAYGGESVYHLTLKASLLLLAIRIFQDLSVSELCPISLPWWLQRAYSIQQRVLSESTHRDTVTPDKLNDLDSDLRARWHSEIGIKELYEGNDRAAKTCFEHAALASGLKWELSGALGKRTKYQVDDVAQLVLLAESSTLQDPGSKINNVLPKKLNHNDDTLLENATFSKDSSPSKQLPIGAIDQTILLGFCLNIQAINPVHSLTTNEMQAYVVRVLDDPHNWSIGTMALFMRSKLEADRSRTVERSVLQMRALIDQMPSADCSVAERLKYFYSLGLPSKWGMQRELGLRYKSIGAVKSALDIFESLEMWEDVIDCWIVLERPDKGKKIVLDLLEGRLVESQQSMRIANGRTDDKSSARLDFTRESRFWCILGDLEPENAAAHYSKAWEVSKETSSRAMRCLGAVHYAKNRHAEAATCLQAALKINPLYIRSWFVLGCCAVRTEQWDLAVEAFNRCVALDEEDSESWNNLASVYLQIGEMEAAKQKAIASEDTNDPNPMTEKDIQNISYQRKSLAFQALKYGVKAGYDNWRIWANYMIVSVDVGELGEACRAFARVLEIQSPKIGEAAIDVAVLERLITAIVRTPFEEMDSGEVNQNQGTQLLKAIDKLFERSIMPILVSLPQVHLLQARLYFWRKQWGNCLECHLRAYRCGIAADSLVETDDKVFEEACVTVEELIDMLMNLGEKTVTDSDGSQKMAMPDWKFQCKSILRTFLGRTKDSFEDQPGWVKCNGLLEELKPAKA